MFISYIRNAFFISDTNCLCIDKETCLICHMIIYGPRVCNKHLNTLIKSSYIALVFMLQFDTFSL